MKIKTSITETRVIEKEIELPFFGKNGYHYIKADEERTIELRMYYFNDTVHVTTWNTKDRYDEIAESEPITEDEFMEQYEKAMQLLQLNVAV